MGEWSKTVGEFGEKTIENFFELIGWGNPPKGLSLDCIKKNEHSIQQKVDKKNDKIKERQTHGIDYLFTYACPLIDSTLKNAVVQVKYTSLPYPNSPSSLFKGYIKELGYSIQCFKNSGLKYNQTKNFSGFNKVEDVGILIWLSHSLNNPDSYDDLIKEVANVQFSETLDYHSIYVVDNKRIGFIYESLNYAKQIFINSRIDFYFPDTGKNINPITKKNSGSVLPIQYINTSILPLRIQSNASDNEITLALFSIDAFSANDLSRLIGLSQELSKNWTNKIYICFPDYDSLNNYNEVKSVFLNFQEKEFIERIKVVSFRKNFRNI